MLPDLEIREFRAFRNLRIERLGRVNLIVGKNNVGKTALLEALYLYAHRGAEQSLERILHARDEVDREPAQRLRREPSFRLAYESLFHGRKRLSRDSPPIHIGPAGCKSKTLSIAFALYREIEEGGGTARVFTPSGADTDITDPRPALTIQFGKTTMGYILLDQDVHRELHYEYGARPADVEAETEPRCVYVPSGGLSGDQTGTFWDKTALTDAEEEVLSSLRIIAPEVERVNLVADPRNGQTRMFVARIGGLGEPVPLRSMGDGLNRVLGVVLGLVNARDGLLLVDEIENGIHYSIQPDLWRLIFSVAHRLNVQVFATTHSWDSIDGFEEAARENEQEEGELIHLEERQGDIYVVLLDERKLGIATRSQIEVR